MVSNKGNQKVGLSAVLAKKLTATTLLSLTLGLATLASAEVKPLEISETKTYKALSSSQQQAATQSQSSADVAIFSPDAIHHPLWAKNGMVASQEALASEIGLQILKDGGNAVDAAVAVGFALAVTLPRAGNIGGGGFMMIYDAKTGKTVALDYREKAPLKAHKDMYLGTDGEADSELSRYHGLAVGVPGTVAGLVTALEQFGSMPLDKVMAPAINLAKNGIEVTPGLSDSLNALENRLKKWPSTAKVFFKPDGSAYEVGERLYQPELAKSLKLIASQGKDGFYQGKTAEQIVKAVNDAGGIMNMQDFADYKAIMREPVRGTYRGYEIASMPPPSSGGAHIVQILNILEGYPLKDYGQNSAQTIHLMSEAMQLAYADRAEYLGDSDFIDVPLSGITSKSYAQKLRAKIDPNKATPASQIKPDNPVPYESDETTHFSIIDKYGNAVANTYTLNFSYGTGLVAEGTGILLNNEMDDFSAKAGVPNAFGVVGSDANAIAPGKRMLSSMAPSLLIKDKQIELVIGTPGGSTIFTSIFQVINNLYDYKLPLAEAVAAPRFHHQLLPKDQITMEPYAQLSPDVQQALVDKGYKLVTQSWSLGDIQAIKVTNGQVEAAADPRSRGVAKVFNY